MSDLKADDRLREAIAEIIKRVGRGPDQAFLRQTLARRDAECRIKGEPSHAR